MKATFNIQPFLHATQNGQRPSPFSQKKNGPRLNGNAPCLKGFLIKKHKRFIAPPFKFRKKESFFFAFKSPLNYTTPTPFAGMCLAVGLICGKVTRKVIVFGVGVKYAQHTHIAAGQLCCELMGRQKCGVVVHLILQSRSFMGCRVK